jgi:hypothetical protein
MGEKESTDFERTAVSGQMVLHDFQSIIGYESASLKKHRNERFCVAFVENGGHAGKAYQTAIKPDSSDDQARKNAHKLLKNEDIRRRISELSAVIRNRTINDLIDFRLKGLRFDPAKFFNATGGKIAIHDVPEEHRVGIGLESRVVDGCLVYAPVFPSPEKSADALQKILGMDKSKMELTGKDGGPVEGSMTLNVYLPDNQRG